MQQPGAKQEMWAQISNRGNGHACPPLAMALTELHQKVEKVWFNDQQL